MRLNKYDISTLIVGLVIGLVLGIYTGDSKIGVGSAWLIILYFWNK